jgi:molybdenum cofactor biosynthesis protein MoaC
MSGKLTHFDAAGQAHMVDVSGKEATARLAVAEGHVKMRPETLALVEAGDAKKGDVLGVARLAGIMGAKRTSDLIPLCHPLPVTKVSVELAPDAALPGVRITATVKTTGQTGRGDGGADRRLGRGADGLRHAEGRREGDGDRRAAPCPEGGRQVGALRGGALRGFAASGVDPDRRDLRPPAGAIGRAGRLRRAYFGKDEGDQA